jgi:hypothetical protein
MAGELQGWRPAPGAHCARCGVNPVGPGGILCPDCRAAIEAANRAPAPGRDTGPAGPAGA